MGGPGAGARACPPAPRGRRLLPRDRRSGGRVSDGRARRGERGGRGAARHRRCPDAGAPRRPGSGPHIGRRDGAARPGAGRDGAQLRTAGPRARLPPGDRPETRPRRGVDRALRADAARLYGAWWDKRPPERTREERRAAEASRGRAGRSGWCTGAALEEGRVEQPGYAPRAGWRRAEGTGRAPENPLGRQASAGPRGAAALQPGRAQRREPEEELEAAG
jgi:hypothetical protein